MYKHITNTYTSTFSFKNLMIAVSDIIGLGKSTLTQKLGEKLNFEIYYLLLINETNFII